MANLSKIRRDRLVAYIERLKQEHTDDESIILFNEIENALTEKRYGLIFEEHTEEVDEMLMENIPVLTADPTRRICKSADNPWNFIIEGDNLQALYLLEKTHKGKVDCIYIDPPYNTGATDWKYNNDYVVREDDFRHSKWLSMMESRLRIARKLLAPNGAMITTIDDNEYAHLQMLINEIFPDAFNVVISIQMNPGGTQGKAFSVTNEYAIITYFRGTQVYRKKHAGAQTYNLRRWGSTSNRYEGATCFYPVILNENNEVIGFGDVLPDELHPSAQVEVQPDGTKYVWPFDINGTEKKWRYARDTVESVRHLMFVEPSKNRIEVMLRRETEPPKTMWVSNDYNAEAYGTKFIRDIIGKDKFTYPKSIYAVKDCLAMFIAGKPHAVVLDFFAGSGTTMNAVNLLNAEDGGHRTCIMVTNNEISAQEEKRLKEAGYKKGDPEWEKYGVAKYVTWPRTVCSINGVDINGKPLVGEYITSTYKTVKKKRTFKQIGFASDTLTLKKKKQIVALCAKGVLPQGLVTEDSAFIVSDDSKHTVSILFDIEAVDEWLAALVGMEHITEFFIVAEKDNTFKKAKEQVESLLGDYEVSEPITIPLSNGFQCNVKFFKCDWVPRVSEDQYLADALMEHIKEMIELEHGIEVDDKQYLIILSEEEADAIEANWHQYTEVKRIFVSRNVLLTTKQNTLFDTVELHVIPDYYFDIEMKEVGESW